MGQSVNEFDVKMRVAFNEISLQPYAKNEESLYQLFEAVLENYNYLSKEFGYSHIIAPTELSSCLVLAGQTFIEWFTTLTTPQKNKIQPLFLKRPFSDNALKELLPEADRYYFECDDPSIPQQYCKGLSTACLLCIPALSIATHSIWKKEQIEFYAYNDDLTASQKVSVLNISSDDVKLNVAVIAYSEANYNFELLESSILKEDKTIKLSGDHHGNNKLESLAKKMFRSKYVTGVINNLPYKRNTSLFIRNICPDGIVEITMYWEDDGYGMALQTTGRNYRETEEIAKILQQEFDR